MSKQLHPYEQCWLINPAMNHKPHLHICLGEKDGLYLMLPLSTKPIHHTCPQKRWKISMWSNSSLNATDKIEWWTQDEINNCWKQTIPGYENRPFPALSEDERLEMLDTLKSDMMLTLAHLIRQEKKDKAHNILESARNLATIGITFG